MYTIDMTNVLISVAGLLVILGAIIGGIIVMIKVIRNSKQPQKFDALAQVNKTGKYAVWLGIIQILVIPLYYLLIKRSLSLKLPPNIASQQLIVEMAIFVIYQTVVASLLIVHGQKLRAITSMNLVEANKSLNWLTGVVAVGLLLSAVTLLAGSSSGVPSVLLLLFASSIARSRTALKRQSQPLASNVAPVDTTPTPPITTS